MSVLGLDIGGASLKAASTTGWSSSARFALWREPHRLSEALRNLVGQRSETRIAITMTGELSDAFETKADGVEHILRAAEECFDRGAELWVWQTTGQFVSMDEARLDAWTTGAANWLALATFAGRFAPQGVAILIDIGSTTTDIIPLVDGVPVPVGRTDPDRLKSAELVYHGVRRTAVASTLPIIHHRGESFGVMRELFATSLDAYLMLGLLPEDPAANDTADNRPETRSFAVDRLSRMIGSDRTRFSEADAMDLAHQVAQAQVESIASACRRVADRSAEPDVILISGEGEFLARRVLEAIPEFHRAKVVSMQELLSAAASRAACALAVATLLEERDHAR